jgi:acyl-CoA reductase-like NAD-dependent aldehyde dehydrogenase
VNESPVHRHSGSDGSAASTSNGVHDVHGHDVDPSAPLPATAVLSTKALSESVRAAVERARGAQYEWNLKPLDERAAALTRAARDMLRRRQEVADLTRAEMGKGSIEGIWNEALGPIDSVRGWVRVVERETRRRRVFLNPLSFPRKSAHVDLVARGVIGVIAPWNYPVAGLYRSVFPALLTGNGIVLKPSEYTPRSSAWLIERLAPELPEGLVQVVQGGGGAGQALIDAGIDACVFTGSPESGRSVRIRCAERGIPSSIEMGGKDPAIVLSDCDLARTVAGITHWALSNAGQACGAIEVAYVDETIADAFVAAMARAWTRLRVGSQPFADVGPLANVRQLEIVSSHVEDARDQGAVVVCGGVPVGGSLCYPPTLIDKCTDTMKVVRDETFGPVLAIVRVAGAADAMRRVNQGRYGLGASIWTTNIARAKRLAERLDVGIVTINNHAFSGAIPALPWSGTRETGFGVANSGHALATFVRPRATLIDRAKSPELFWMPYDDTLAKVGDLLADLQVGHYGDLWQLPFAIRKRVRSVKDKLGMK